MTTATDIAQITFHVSSTRLFTVTVGREDIPVDVDDGYDGMLEGITITNADGSIYDYFAGYDTVYAADRAQYDLILQAADAADIMLPDDSDDLVLFYSR